MTAVSPQTLQPWYREFNGDTLNKLFGYPVYSSEDGITAATTQTQAAAYALTAQLSRIATVANSGDGVLLPKAEVGKSILVNNAGANTMKVFGSGSDTINGTAGATGVSQLAGVAFVYTCTTAGAWRSVAATGSFTGTFDGVVGGNTPAAGTFTNLLANAKLTYTGVRIGTFVNNGVTPVTVANANVTANSMIIVSLNTVGGTVGALPHVATITPTTGFTTVGAASDTSTYNYMIIEAA